MNPYDIDSPESTIRVRELLRRKRFLRRLYADWYSWLASEAKTCGEGIHLEVGSGGGFLKTIFPEAVTSDILDLPFVDVVCSAERLPFADESLASVMMLNVFHHIPRPWMFLEEAQRCLVFGGKILMIEPANTLWARFVYRRFHHEPFDPDGGWEIRPGNPLSNANQAFAYIYFERDLALFEERFPSLRVNEMRSHAPFLYLLSGGLSRRALLPAALYGAAKFAERMILPFNRHIGMFYAIEIEKINNP